MKPFKVLLLTLLAVFLTGCYTQLQLAENGGTKKKSYAESYENKAGAQDYIYKNKMLFYSNDYNYGRYWGASYYYTPELYNSYWHHYGNGLSYSYLFGRLYFGPDFYGTRFTFAISPLSPFYYRYYDPFAYGGYGNVFAYNYINYYNAGGYGYVGYDKKSKDVRYGPRSIGTNRVDGNVNRSRNSGDISRRSSAVNSRSEQSVYRSRTSVGTTRTRGTVNRGSGSSVGQNRNRVRSSNDTSNARSRERGSTVRSKRGSGNTNGITRVRSVNRGSELSRRWNNTYNREQDLQTVQRSRFTQEDRKQTTTFFNKVKGYLKNSTAPFHKKIDLGHGSVRSRIGNTGSSNATIKRNTSFKSRGTVTRSRSSSSSKSRSRGSSSRSKNGSNSNSSDRSRGNG